MSLNTLNVIQIGRVGTDALYTCIYRLYKILKRKTHENGKGGIEDE